MPISFTSFGAAKEVTGSTHLLCVDNKKILIDCGLFQGKRIPTEEKNRNFPFNPEEIDSVILSHGHCDHSCRLPYLVMKGFQGNIYATPATRDIAGLVMADTAHIMQKDFEWLKKKKANYPYGPLFGVKEVVRALDQFVTISYKRTFMVTDNVRCTFFNAGHILGSSMPLIDIADTGTIAYTGDLGRKGTPIIQDPEYLPDIDYLICEATYGNRKHDPIEDACRQLVNVIRETVERGGKIIIPAFAVERTQDLIYYLNVIMSERKVPKINVFVDSPMAFNATSIFKVHQECYDDSIHEQFLMQKKNPFGFENLHYITNVEESKKLNEYKDPCIIISSSGMCEAGRILHHLKNNIEDPKNTILIVGYMAEDTLGRRIVERQPIVKIFGQEYHLNAKVKILNTFSAHADYEDIIDFVKHLDLNKLRKVFLVHAEENALNAMKEHLLNIGVKDVQIVEENVQYNIFENNK